MITINAVQCKGCNDIIYSRSQTDERSCGCKSSSIVGGIDKIKFKSKTGCMELKISIDSGIRELYEDWALWHDNYGIIKNDSDLMKSMFLEGRIKDMNNQPVEVKPIVDQTVKDTKQEEKIKPIKESNKIKRDKK